MKAIFFLFSSLFSLIAQCSTYYVATNGSDGNPGTITQPFATWQKGFDNAVAGDIVYIRGGSYYPAGLLHGSGYYGVYVSGHNGTSNDSIKVWAYPGEVPILDCTNMNQAGTHTGLSLNYCSYWSLNGLWIKNVKEYPGNYASTTGFADGNHLLVEQCRFSDSGNGTVVYFNDNVTYKNCDSFNNVDNINSGDFSNGFGGMVNPGQHVIMTGCRAWANSDDGFDYAGSAGGYITWINCWAFNNGSGARGNGCGFKTGMATGTKESGPQRILTNCLAFNNLSLGFDEAQDMASYAAIEHNLFNCTSFHNGSDGFSFNYPSSTVDKIRNCISFQDTYIGTISSGNLNDHNSWNLPVAVSINDFVSISASGADGPRASDGKLPSLLFLHLATGSQLIDAGISSGLSFTGSAPDLGAYETILDKNIITSSSTGSVVDNSIQIYPNPANDFITIEIGTTSSDPQYLRIIDTGGKLYREIRFDGAASMRIPVNLESGIYIVQVISGKLIKHIQKLVVI